MPLKLQGRWFGSKRIFLVVAISGRAIAESLKACGYPVAVVDGFSDMDTCSVAVASLKVSRTTSGLDRSETLKAVQRLHNKYHLKGLFYDAALEFDPGMLDAFPLDKVIGNSSTTLRMCKNPEVFFSALDANQIPYPEISFKSVQGKKDLWLLKKSRSAGGVGVTTPTDIQVYDQRSYYQRKMEGIPFSLTFLSNGQKLKVLGFNTLWCRDTGAGIPFLYEGAINHVNLTEEQRLAALDHATYLVREFELVGLNSVDFILSDERVFVLEVNPRIPATFELYETRHGNLMRDHINACVHARLSPAQERRQLHAHVIIFAPATMCIPNSFNWPVWTADQPHPGEVIRKNEPVCSVFAGGKNVSQVCTSVWSRKKIILDTLMQAGSKIFKS